MPHIDNLFSFTSKSSRFSAVPTKAGKTPCVTTSLSMSASLNYPRHLAGELFRIQINTFISSVSNLTNPLHTDWGDKAGNLLFNISVP